MTRSRQEGGSVKIKLIVEVYQTAQVAECSWRDATKSRLVEVEVPDEIGKLIVGPERARVVGAVQEEFTKP